MFEKFKNTPNNLISEWKNFGVLGKDSEMELSLKKALPYMFSEKTEEKLKLFYLSMEKIEKSVAVKCQNIKEITDLLNSEEVWVKWINGSKKNKKLIEKTKIYWEGSREFHGYTTSELIQIYQEYLSQYSSFIENAKAELIKSQNKLPAQVYDDFNDYLESFGHAIAESRMKIRYALIERKNNKVSIIDSVILKLKKANINIKSAPENKFYLTTKEDLESIGLILNEHENEVQQTDSTYQGLTRKLFQRSSSVDLGCEIERTQSASGLEYKMLSQFVKLRHTEIFENKSGKLFIPECIAKTLPKKPFYKKLPIFLQGIFRRTKFQYEFLENKDCQELLNGQSKVPSFNLTTLSVQNIFGARAWVEWEKMQFLVNKELARCEDTLPQRKKLFFGKGTKFLNDYRGHILGVGRLILQNKIGTLSKFIEHYSINRPEVFINLEQLKKIKLNISNCLRYSRDYAFTAAEFELNIISNKFSKLESFHNKNFEKNTNTTIKVVDTTKAELAEQLTTGVVSMSIDNHDVLKAIDQPLSAKSVNYEQAYTMFAVNSAKDKALDILINKVAIVPPKDDVAYQIWTKIIYDNAVLANSYILERGHNVNAAKAYRMAIYTFYQKFIERLLSFTNKKFLEQARNIESIENNLLKLCESPLLRDTVLPVNINTLMENRKSEKFNLTSYKVICNAISVSFKNMLATLDSSNNETASIDNENVDNNKIYKTKKM